MVIESLRPDAAFVIIPVEDTIADRIGQYASGTAPNMLDQARALFRLHADADLDYMDKRIRHETAGDHGVGYLQS